VSYSWAEDWQNINDLLGDEPSNDVSSSQKVLQKDKQPALIQHKSFSEVIKAYGDAVAVVVIVGAKGQRIPIGTAWGVAPGKFATNGHISRPVKNYLAKGWVVQVQLNNSSRKIFSVKSAFSHPAYDPNNGNFDVGMLHVSSTDHGVWSIASDQELRDLSAGDDVALLGFPMEQLIKGNININKPLASAQIGNIVALSDYTLKNAGFDNNYAIRHSIPATGGASGSPIFGKSGKVIGLLNAGNISANMSLEEKNGRLVPVYKRLPHAALINYGVRVDLVRDLL
jgi:hypothetical protein